MRLLGPRITARIRTVAGIPCARCLLEPLRARSEVHRDPTSPLIVHFRAQRSDVDSDLPKDRPARIGAETPACQLLRSSRCHMPGKAASAHIVEHLHQGRIVRPRTIDEITEMNTRSFPFASGSGHQQFFAKSNHSKERRAPLGKQRKVSTNQRSDWLT
jgi:hypothetical protein